MGGIAAGMMIVWKTGQTESEGWFMMQSFELIN